MGDFVTPERIRLPLSGGQFIDIKKRLNHGETEDMYASWGPTMGTDGSVHVQRGAVRTNKVLFYLLGWSLTMEDGTPVAFSIEMPEMDRRATLRSLDPERFTEIHEAIDKHETGMEKERTALKKTTAGSNPVGVTSPSPSLPANGSNGSAPLTSTTIDSSLSTSPPDSVSPTDGGHRTV